MAARVFCLSFFLLLSLGLSSAGRDANMMDSKGEFEQEEVGFDGSVGGHVGVDTPGFNIGGSFGGSIGFGGDGSGCGNPPCGGGCSGSNCQFNPPNCDGNGCPVTNCPVTGCHQGFHSPPIYGGPLYCVPVNCPTNQCSPITLHFSEVASGHSEEMRRVSSAATDASGSVEAEAPGAYF